MKSTTFITGYPPAPEPLARFLPPIQDQVLAPWLSANIPAGAWVLDPFGAAPRITLEAVQEGYHVIVAANNPISRFLIETLAASPTEDEFRAALAHLAGARVGDQRLEPYIQSLYQTECNICDSPVTVDAYIWNREEASPSTRIYDCPACGASGEFPAVNLDYIQARKIAVSIELHRARALQRVVDLDDPDRQHAEDALSVYVPRAVLALFTIINKLDTLEIPEQQKDFLRALLLSTFDLTNSLWHEDGSRPRPRQLSIPARFIERNVWKSLNDSISLWQTESSPFDFQTCTPGTGLRPSAELIIFEGPIRDLVGTLSPLNINGIIAPLPRPNQAYWTLSALWSGWLWGRQAAAPFKVVLRRKRYDWNWHTAALHAAFESFTTRLSAGLPCFGLIGETEPGFFAAAQTAAKYAGLQLEAVSMRHQVDQAQLHWIIGEKNSPIIQGSAKNIEPIIVRSATNFLENQAEPVTYPKLHAASLVGLYEKCFPIEHDDIEKGQAITKINSFLQQSLSYRNGFLHFGSSTTSYETGSWWLQNPEYKHIPAADRVEIALVNYLIEHKAASYRQLDQLACQELCDLHTPDPSLVQTIIESYAKLVPQTTNNYQLRPEDQPQQRRLDIVQMKEALGKLGKQLGYKIHEEETLFWKSEEGIIVFNFYFLASSNIAKFVLDKSIPPGKSILVLPGGRANLVMYKLQRDRNLAQAVESGWRFLKFRHVLRLAEDPHITQENFADQFDFDPLTYTASQMRLL